MVQFIFWHTCHDGVRKQVSREEHDTHYFIEAGASRIPPEYWLSTKYNTVGQTEIITEPLTEEDLGPVEFRGGEVNEIPESQAGNEDRDPEGSPAGCFRG